MYPVDGFEIFLFIPKSAYDVSAFSDKVQLRFLFFCRGGEWEYKSHVQSALKFIRPPI